MTDSLTPRDGRGLSSERFSLRLSELRNFLAEIGVSVDSGKMASILLLIKSLLLEVLFACISTGFSDTCLVEADCSDLAIEVVIEALT